MQERGLGLKSNVAIFCARSRFQNVQTQFHALQLGGVLTANYSAPCVRVSITNASAIAT